MIFNPEYDAKKALQIADGGQDRYEFSDYSSIYRFTTENLSELLSHFSFEDKKVLTICSSGDHLLNTILLGANQIDCFDINILTKYYTELKIAAIKGLNFEEFVKFFIINSNIQEVYYYRLRNDLGYDSKTFWDIVFGGYCDKRSIMDTSLLCSGMSSRNHLFQNNLYLNQENYSKLREKIDFKEINFIHSPVQNLSENVFSNYDLMFLSNINGYLDQIYIGTSLERYRKYKKYLLKELSEKLNVDGELIAAYLYGGQYNTDILRAFSDVARKIDFVSAFDFCGDDTALVLSKKR